MESELEFYCQNLFYSRGPPVFVLYVWIVQIVFILYLQG